MKVEIWSDIVCPWCYIGKRRFESALARFPHAAEVEVEYRAFELDPGAPASDGRRLDERLAAKYGVPLEQARAMNRRVSDAATGEGLDFRLEDARPGNTLDAHRLVHLAATRGRQAEMKERLLAAYFTEGRPIGDRDTLVAIAAELGIAAAEATTALEGDRFVAEVRAEEREASALGITGVPFFVLDRRYGISGAQPAELMLEALETAWREAHPIQLIGAPGEAGAPAAEPDDSCADGTCSTAL